MSEGIFSDVAAHLILHTYDVQCMKKALITVPINVDPVQPVH